MDYSFGGDMSGGIVIEAETFAGIATAGRGVFSCVRLRCCMI
jgi:hypothetical protein